MKKQNKDSFRQEHKKFLQDFLKHFGEDPARGGLIETPDRIYRMYKELLSGYSVDPASVFKTFDGNGYGELVTVANISIHSLCEHHMIPFRGKVHIGYVPDGKILGLSKFARLVEVYARRLQVQENLTNQISEAIDKYLKPKGSIVHVEAEHFCMSMRGVRKEDAYTKTTVKKGVLIRDLGLIDQFYRDIDKNRTRQS